jgi:hypothetical protein
MRRNPETGSRKLSIKKRSLALYCLSLIIFLLSFVVSLPLILTSHCFLLPAFAEDNPLDTMRDETLALFKPLNGKITSIEEKKAAITLGAKDSVKNGMRFNIFHEEAPFIHPVTKQTLGNLEAFVGKLEIRDVNADASSGSVIQGDAKEGDLVRISETPISFLFCQSKSIDWHLADTYYRKLRESGRFTMIDTDLETDDPSRVIEEARKLKADVALLLTAKTGESGTSFLQRLFWVSDGTQFSEIKGDISATFAKQSVFGEKFLLPTQAGALLQFNLPVDAKLMTTGDMEGNGKDELIFSTGSDIVFYILGSDLQPALGGLRISGPRLDDHIWLDAVDLNKNGKDEIIVTSMKGKEVVSYIYELKDSEFVLLFKDNVFLRRLGDGLIAQAYSRTDGFEGNVYDIVWEGGNYRKGNPVTLPKGVNIYDFTYYKDPQAGRLTVAYDGDGHLTVYDSKDVQLWKSKAGNGGFPTTFQKYSPSSVTDRGEWSVKDRLFVRHNTVLTVQRVPLLTMIKGLGYRKSRIQGLWWNGFSMEGNIMVDNISGQVFDYLVSGDTVIVLTSPLFGIKPGNIFKGENPIKTELSVYPLKKI